MAGEDFGAVAGDLGSGLSPERQYEVCADLVMREILVRGGAIDKDWISGIMSEEDLEKSLKDLETQGLVKVSLAKRGNGTRVELTEDGYALALASYKSKLAEMDRLSTDELAIM